MARRYGSFKMTKCVQCGEWFDCNRVTAKFCNATCRKRASRGIEPTDKYKNGLFSETERMLAKIAETSPNIFRKISVMREHHGIRSVERLLEIIELLELIKE